MVSIIAIKHLYFIFIGSLSYDRNTPQFYASNFELGTF
jgi:hypothetical protein